VFPLVRLATYRRGMDTHQRVWLITGCSAGFGRAIAQAALARGDRVVATARRAEALTDLAGDDVLVVALDVTSRDEIDAAVRAALERFGRIDVLVNNAGYGSIGAVEEIDPGDLRALMDTMFFGAVALTQAVLPHMRAQGSGTIVQISSQGGQLAFAGVGAYCAAKFALEGLSEALAAEVAPLGIRTLIVEPGAFRTGLFRPGAAYESAEMPEYADVVGPTRAYVREGDGQQPGDPVKAAEAIVAALAADDPPLRLVLGADAIGNIRRRLESLTTELARWEDVGAATAL
jgi:NAD(P)-dependent dehydrogenase (short-subunit alcohol dehydrogenase family)